MESPVVEYADATCMFVRWKSVAMPIFGHAPSSVGAAGQLGRLLVQHGKRVGPGKLVEITLLDRESPMPEPDVRQQLESMVPLVSPYYGCVSAVFEGSGFRSAMIRGLLTSFQLISRLKYPHRVFADVGDCARWVTPHARTLGMRLDTEDELVGVLAEVRSMAAQRGILTP